MRRRGPKLFLKGRSARARRRLLAVFLLVFASATPRPLRAGCVPFELEPPISTLDVAAKGVAAADIDGDGDLDVLCAAADPNRIAWYENEGNGTDYTLRTISTASSSTTSVDAADFDRDGDPDLLFADLSLDRIAWFRNLVGGTSWSLVTISAAAGGARQAVAWDFDADGDLDVVGAEPFDQELVLYLNLGGGTSWAAVLVATALDGPGAAAPADIDGDGDTDLFAAAYDSPTDAILWFRNQNTSSDGWKRFTVLAAAGGVLSVAAADLDRDGDPDLLSASSTLDRVAWHENVSHGASFALHTISLGELDAFDVDAADFDADGDLDVVAVGRSDGEAAWFENDGGAGTWTPHILATALDLPRAVAVADLDRDGDVDALLGGSSGDEVRWLSNRRVHGGALFGELRTSGSLNAPRQLAEADLDRDGDLDLIVASQLENRVSFLENRDPGWSHHTIATTALGPLSVAVGDVDGDGFLDVLAASRDDDTVAWYENDATPADDTPWTERVITAQADVARQVVVADIDRDGDLDAVSASRNDDTVAWYENDGSPLDGGWTTHEIFTLANGAFSVAVADVDGDGHLDVAAVSYYDSEIRWFENDHTPADGGWDEISISSETLNPRFVAAGDVDRDGDVDLVTASAGDESIVLHTNFFGNGSAWVFVPISTTATDIYSVRLADLDGDGDLDVAGAVFGGDAVRWYENDGAGQGWTTHTIATGIDGPTSVALADFDRDGSLDAAIAVGNDDLIFFISNSTTLVFAEGQETGEQLACWSPPPLP